MSELLPGMAVEPTEEFRASYGGDKGRSRRCPTSGVVLRVNNRDSHLLTIKWDGLVVPQTVHRRLLQPKSL